MSAEQDYRYVKYLVARLAAYSNVWWSLANEYDFLLDVKPIAQWDRYFHIIEENDPYRHPKSIHNGEETMNFNHRKPWVDHVCIQNWNAKLTNQWRQEWGKPIVNDEPEYEGDILMAWGNLSAQELVHRFWLTVTRGGYAGHGETFSHKDDLLWWAKGGRLRGESWKRIGFLRDLIEADVKIGLDPAPPGTWPWTRVSVASEGDYRLIYLGEHQPSLWVDGLPTDGWRLRSRRHRYVGDDDHAGQARALAVAAASPPARRGPFGWAPAVRLRGRNAGQALSGDSHSAAMSSASRARRDRPRRLHGGGGRSGHPQAPLTCQSRFSKMESGVDRALCGQVEFLRDAPGAVSPGRRGKARRSATWSSAPRPCAACRRSI